MSITFDFSGIPQFEQASKEASAWGLTRGAIALQRAMKAVQQQTPRTGKTYPIHVPSKPFESPARQTGALVNSISHQPATANNLVALAGTYLPYGRHLEFGHISTFGRLGKPKKASTLLSAVGGVVSSRKTPRKEGPPPFIAPRPWVQVALQKSRAKIVEEFKIGFEYELRKARAAARKPKP